MFIRLPVRETHQLNSRIFSLYLCNRNSLAGLFNFSRFEEKKIHFFHFPIVFRLKYKKNLDKKIDFLYFLFLGIGHHSTSQCQTYRIVYFFLFISIFTPPASGTTRRRTTPRPTALWTRCGTGTAPSTPSSGCAPTWWTRATGTKIKTRPGRTSAIRRSAKVEMKKIEKIFRIFFSVNIIFPKKQAVEGEVY